MLPTPAVARAEAAARLIRPHADASERARHLAPESVAALVDAGTFKLLVPAKYGGAEATVATAVAFIEAIARADGSAGWCAMIGMTSALMAAFLPEATAEAIYTPASVVTGGVFAPFGRATRTAAGDYRVSGRWPFCSGCQHADWLMGSALVDTGDPSKPELRSLLFRREQIQIHADTWDTSGLRGTGSHDFSVHDLEVPRSHSLSLFAAPVIDAPLYRQPFFGTLSAGVAAVALGIARNALDSLLELAAQKPSGPRKTIAHRELVQLQFARAEAELHAARSGLYAAIATTDDEVTTTGQASLRTRAMLRAAACHAATASARAVDIAYEAGGASSIYTRSPLQRCFRDIHVATQHIMVAPTSATLAGRVLLGLDADTSTL